MATAREIEAEAARPMAFFPHDTNASQDIKLELLLDDYGMAGYGRWWRLCELLGAADGHRIEIGNARVARVVTRNLMFDSVNDLMAFVKELADLGLIDMPGDGYISSKRMNRNAEYFGKKRAAGRKGGQTKRSSGVGSQ